MAFSKSRILEIIIAGVLMAVIIPVIVPTIKQRLNIISGEGI